MARFRTRAYVPGHGALTADGLPAGPFGIVPSEVTLEEEQHSARLATLAILKATLGDLNRVSAWLTVNGYANVEPRLPTHPAVMNPCSESLIIDLYGTDASSHAGTAVGVGTVPLNLPVVISGRSRDHPPNPEAP